MPLPPSFDAERPSFTGFLAHTPPEPAGGFVRREADALGRAVRARQAYQDRLVAMFDAHVNGLGPEPTDSDLRVFALLAAAEQRLEENLALARGCAGHEQPEDEVPVFRQRRAS